MAIDFVLFQEHDKSKSGVAFRGTQSTRAEFQVGQVVDSQHKQLSGFSWLFEIGNQEMEIGAGALLGKVLIFVKKNGPPSVGAAFN